MDLNPICHPSPTNKMKCYFLDNVHLLMIGWAGQWTQTQSSTSLQPKKWNATFWFMFNFWCWPDWSMDSNPIYHPSPANKMKYSFLDYVQVLMISWAGRWTQTPFTTPLQPKNEILIFWLCSTSDDQLGWSMDLNPICQPSPAKKIKCYFLDYVQLLMISWAGQWTETPSATPLRPKTWNAHIWITFNFWWSAGLVNWLKPHPPPLSSQKSEMLIFVLHSTCDVGQTGQWTWT